MHLLSMPVGYKFLDEGEFVDKSSADARLPYQVPTTDIETIQLFQALHRPHQRIALATTRKHQMYSRYVSAFQN